jgi:hypothetical protein
MLSRDIVEIQTEAKANARLDTASLAYAKALRDYRAFFRQGQSRVARAGG